MASEVGGVPESVEDGVAVFLVSPKGPETLTEALRKLITVPEFRHRMGQAGRKKALQEFTPSRMLREMKRVYEEVLGNQGR